MYSCIHTHPKSYGLANFVSYSSGRESWWTKLKMQNVKPKWSWSERERLRQQDTLKGEWEELLGQVYGSGADNWFFFHFLLLPCQESVLSVRYRPQLEVIKTWFLLTRQGNFQLRLKFLYLIPWHTFKIHCGNQQRI